MERPPLPSSGPGPAGPPQGLQGLGAQQPPLPREPYPYAAPYDQQQQQPAFPAAPQQQGGLQQPPYDPHQQQQQQQPPGEGGRRRKKARGRRGSGLEARQRALKQQAHAPPANLGYFGSLQPGLQPSLQELRQENWQRTQQHYGRPPYAPKPHGAAGRPGGSHRRSRGGKGKAGKPPKLLAPTPRPHPLTPAAGNPLATPATAAGGAAPGGDVERLQAEGLAAGLDWYGTNENSAALFLGGQATTSDSEFDDGGDDFDEAGGSEGEGPSGGNGSGDGNAGAGRGAGGGGGAGPEGGYDEAALPRSVRARLVEQEAYIAELEDQNLRLREQLDMLQQEVEELRGGGRAPVDSEEGWAEHSEGSLPADHSVMNGHH